MKWINIYLSRTVSRLRGSHFLGNVTRLVSGEVLAQAVGFACLPWLTRLYGPAAFGILGVFVAVSEVGGKVASLRYDIALVLPKRDQEAWALLRFSATFSLLFTILLLSASFPFRTEISVLLGVEEMAPYFLFIALMILGISWQGLGNYWSMREKHYKAIAQSCAGSSVLGNTFKLLAGLLGYGPGGLLLGTALQRWVYLLLIRLHTPSAIWKHPVVKGEAQVMARTYSEFPKYRMPQDTLNSFTRLVPNVLLAAFFSPVIAGFYILATRILSLPFNLVQEAVRKVFYVKAIEVQREGGSLFKLCVSLSSIIFVCMVPVAFVVFIWGSAIFEFIFGTEWRETGSYAKWIIVGVAFGFTALPSSAVIPIMGWNRFYLVYEIITTLLRLIVIFTVAMTMTAYMSVAAIALSAAASNFALTFIVLTRLRKEGRRQVTEPSNAALS